MILCIEMKFAGTLVLRRYKSAQDVGFQYKYIEYTIDIAFRQTASKRETENGALKVSLLQMHACPCTTVSDLKEHKHVV